MVINRTKEADEALRYLNDAFEHVVTVAGEEIALQAMKELMQYLAVDEPELTKAATRNELPDETVRVQIGAPIKHPELERRIVQHLVAAQEAGEQISNPEIAASIASSRLTKRIFKDNDGNVISQGQAENLEVSSAVDEPCVDGSELARRIFT